MTMDESGGAKGVKRNKALKLKENEDRLSALPDSLIHHILSFLPSTREAIRTGVLSKRWLHQWTRVPNLIFDFSGMSPDSSPENISHTTSTIARIIDNTLILHECSKIHKFHFISDDYYEYTQDPNYNAKLRFAIRRQTAELIMKIYRDEEGFRLPYFFFNQPCLVNLHLSGCSVTNSGIVNLESLKVLYIEDCICDDQTIRNIVSGSPLLQSLELDYSHGLNQLVIVSESLKRLVIEGIDSYLDISCPNLVKFNFTSTEIGCCDKVSKSFLSDSLKLESLELRNCEFPSLRIALKFLKKLVLDSVVSHEIEISCPRLEELELCDLGIETIRLMNLPSSIHASLDSYTHDCDKGCKENVAKQILEQLQHLKKLKLGSSFVRTLSALELGGLSYPLLNSKSLTLKGPIFAHIPGIVCALRSSPVLERLIVKFKPLKIQKLADLSDLDHSGDNYWNSNESRLCSLVLHLRTAYVIGFSQRWDDPKLVLDFVEFLLKNAVVLEKVVFMLEDCDTDYMFKVSQKLLRFPRCSNAIVELLCSK